MAHGGREQGWRLDGLRVAILVMCWAGMEGWLLVNVEWTPRPMREMKCHTPPSLPPHPPTLPLILVDARVVEELAPRMCLASQRHDMRSHA